MSDNQLNPKSYRQPVEVTFTFPDSMAMATGYKSVTLRELKASAESRAMSRAATTAPVLCRGSCASRLFRP